MRYRELRPGPGLAPWIDRLWTLERGSVQTGPPARRERIWPDGRAELIVHLGDPVREGRTGGELELRCGAFVVGQLDGCLELEATGRLHVVAARFRPDALPAFFALAADQLTGRAVPLSDLWGPDGTDLVERLGEPAARSPVERLRAVLRQRLDPSLPRDRAVAAALARLGRSAGRERIASLARRIGLGRRQLERRFLRQVGLPPKRMAMILRFQAAARMVAAGELDAAAVAAECGFADQAHLIRECRRFAGTTPTRLDDPRGGIGSTIAGFAGEHRRRRPRTGKGLLMRGSG